MSFFNNLVSEFTGQGQGQGGQGQGGQGYGQEQQGYGQQQPPPPQVQYPWRAVWDARDGRYVFENEQTGQRTLEHPGGGYGGQQGGYGQQQGGYGQQQGGYPNEQRNYGNNTSYAQEKPNHHYGGMALAGAAGLAGGALLMHEGENIHNDYDRDKYRVEGDIRRDENGVEQRFDNGIQDVQDFPDDASRWAGRETQRVEDIPDRIEQRWDNGVQDVEDVPDDVAGWAGRKVGDVDRFDDGIRDNYDGGRNQQRYDDNNNGNW